MRFENRLWSLKYCAAFISQPTYTSRILKNNNNYGHLQNIVIHSMKAQKKADNILKMPVPEVFLFGETRLFMYGFI